MSLFENVLSDSKGVQESLLGPDYQYFKNIKMPNEMSINSTGTLPQLGRNVNGLIGYVELLVAGGGQASKTGRPLGNKFFMKTGAQCKDINTGEKVDRFIYVNNVPQGNIPFVSGLTGANFSELKGLIPGVMGNLNVLNPFAIMSAFLAGSEPDCKEITLETIDVNNNRSTASHFVTMIDLENMDPCSFSERKNPVNGKPCTETFTNNTDLKLNENLIEMPDDAITQIYFALLATLGIYMFYKIAEKTK